MEHSKFREVYPQIYVETAPYEGSAFLDEIRADLNIINSKSVGCRLLKKIRSGLHPIFIEYSLFSGGACYENDDYKIRGKGCSAHIMIWPSMHVTTLGLEKLDSLRCPSFIRLAHELIHAYHIVYGKISIGRALPIDRDLWGSEGEEEYHTIMGFPSKNEERINPKITENAIRIEHKLGVRFSALDGNAKITSAIRRAAKACKVVMAKANPDRRENPPPPPIIKKLSSDSCSSCCRTM